MTMLNLVERDMAGIYDPLMDESQLNTEFALPPTICAPHHRETPVAWSVDDTVPYDPTRRPLSRPLRALLATVAVGAAGTAAFLIGTHTAANTSTAPITSTPTAVQTDDPDVVAPPRRPLPSSLPDIAQLDPAMRADSIYFNELDEGGLRITNRAQAITYGHIICNILATPAEPSQVQVAGMIVDGHPDYTYATAMATVKASIDGYCPRFANR